MARLLGRAAVLLVACLGLVGCVVWPAGAGPGASPMSLEEALARRDRGEAVLIDVRSREQYAEGHIPGALSIPGSKIEGRAAELRRMALPILYCG
jgi:hypothetical protein